MSRPVENFYGLVVMDNYDLSNLSFLGESVDSEEHHSWLTDEQNKQATFLGRSATATTPEQPELQQRLLTDEEQLSEQRVLADFDISLLPSTRDLAKFDESEDPFAALAAYQPPSFDGDSQPPPYSKLGPGSGFLEGFTAEEPTDVVLAEPRGNDFLELSVQSEHLQHLKPPHQPAHSRGKSGAKGISIPESANPDTVPAKRSGKRHVSEPEIVVTGVRSESSIKESIDLHFQESSHRSDRPTVKRQKLDGSETEFLPLPQGMVTRSQSVAMPEKSADSQKNTEQNPDECFKERVKKETAKWVIRLDSGAERRYVCSYPNCSSAYTSIGHLYAHIFKHIGISIYKCSYPECSDHPYFRSSAELIRHVQAFHTDDAPYVCSLCNKRFRYWDNCKRHIRRTHKIAP